MRLRFRCKSDNDRHWRKNWRISRLKLLTIGQCTLLWPFSKSKFNLKSDCVNLVTPASPIECLLYLTYVRAIQYKLGPERLTRLGNLNVLRLPVNGHVTFKIKYLLCFGYHVEFSQLAKKNCPEQKLRPQVGNKIYRSKI